MGRSIQGLLDGRFVRARLTTGRPPVPAPAPVPDLEDFEFACCYSFPPADSKKNDNVVVAPDNPTTRVCQISTLVLQQSPEVVGEGVIGETKGETTRTRGHWNVVVDFVVAVGETDDAGLLVVKPSETRIQQSYCHSIQNLPSPCCYCHCYRRCSPTTTTKTSRRGQRKKSIRPHMTIWNEMFVPPFLQSKRRQG